MKRVYLTLYILLFSATISAGGLAVHPVPDDKTLVEHHIDLPKFGNEHKNFWLALRDDFKLKSYYQENIAVKKHIRWLQRHPDYFDRVFSRAEPFLHLIHQEINEKNLPAELIFVPAVESAFDPYAYSHGEAAGIWQIIPDTADRLGITQNWWYDGRRDIVDSTRAALDYFVYLHNEFSGDWLLTMAAYNSGEGTVGRAIRKNKNKQLDTDFWSLRLPRETKRYVPRWLALSYYMSQMIEQQDFSRIPAIHNAAQLTPVTLKSQLNLALAARLAKLSLKELYHYNPGFNHWSTLPDRAHHLLLPIVKAEQFKTALNKIPESERTRYQRYIIQPGDSLSEIAAKFETTTQVIKLANKMSNNRIIAGKALLIPSQAAALSQQHNSTHKNTTSQYYSVKNGDNLWLIAKKHHTSIAMLARYNQLDSTKPLKIGQVLHLPKQSYTTKLPQRDIVRKISYRVRSGDSLAAIANRFKVSVPQINRWNPVVRKKVLRKGQRLVLFVDVTRQSATT